MSPPTPARRDHHSESITKDLALKVLGSVLFTMMTGIATYMAATLTRLTDSVGTLNERMAVIALSVAEQKSEVGDLSLRVRTLELRRVP